MTAEAPAAPARRSPLPWLTWPVVRYCLLVFVVLRLAMFAIALLTFSLIDVKPGAAPPGWPLPPITPGWHNAVTLWERNDALWFLKLGATGYQSDDQSAAFFPLYPSAIRVFGTVLGHHWLLAAFLISNLALLGGLILLYRLSVLEFGEQRARYAVLYLALFPTALFLFSPYSESVFLLFAVGAFLAARRRRWLLAGGLALLAALTRSIGVILVLPLATEALHQAGEARREGRWRRPQTALALASCLLPTIGTAGYLLWWQLQVGDWRRPLSQQSAWGRQFSWPWETAWAGIRIGWTSIGQPGGGYFTLDLVLVALAFAACVYVTVRFRPLYAVYAWSSLLFPMFAMWPPRPFMSDTRFLLPVFPIFWAFAAAGDRLRGHHALLSLSAGGLAVLSVLACAFYPVF